jgi:hypothetical protein
MIGMFPVERFLAILAFGVEAHGPAPGEILGEVARILMRLL